MSRIQMNWFRSRCLAACALFVGLVAAGPALSEDGVKETTKFLRLQRSMEGKPLAFQTAIARYAPADGEGKTVVDLIGVVHIGDRDYYEKLNKQFESYDVLLYELVAAPEDQVPTREKVREADGLMAMLQKAGPALLGLESQMDHVDYTKKNFVHADLSPAEMAKVIKQRGDDPITLFLSITADILRQQNLDRLRAEQQPEKDAVKAQKPQEIDPFEVLLSPTGGRLLKLTLAEQMASQSSPDAGLGKTLGTILIDDRNAAAMNVFQKELAKGRKRIGIFYGAAHMPDFEKRLRDDFGLERQRVTWLTAWDLAKKKSAGSPINRLLKTLLD